MADANPRIHLGRIVIGLEPQIYVAPTNCWTIELTADKEWCWASDKDSGVWRMIPALKAELIISMANTVIKEGERIVWVKASVAGFLYEKCTR